MEKLHVIKIGGNIIDDNDSLLAFLKDFAALPGKKLLVHGGGKMATRLAGKLGIHQTMVEGRRITDKETLQVAVMVYAGWINKNITARLQSCLCNAIGLSGADAGAMKTVKRQVADLDFGFVGDVVDSSADISVVVPLLEQGLVPVFSAITHDGEGQLFNTNADTIAAAWAVALSARYDVRLLYCFEKKGVLENRDDENSVITALSAGVFAAMKSNGTVSEGMAPKLENAFRAKQAGVKKVYIGSAEALTDMVNGKDNVGTGIFN